MIYDTIIIGGGLAGTNLANKLFNSNRDNFLLFESRSYFRRKSENYLWKKLLL